MFQGVDDKKLGNSTVALVKKDDRYAGVREVLHILFRTEGQPDLIGKRVLVKPNLLSAHNPFASISADAVKAVLDSILPFNPKEVIVADGSAIGDTDEAFANFGYRSELKGYPIKLVDLNEDEFVEVELLGIKGEKLKAKLSRLALESDFRISLTLPKTHDFAILTLSAKNMVGCLVGGESKMKVHGVVKWSQIDYEKSVQVIHKNIVALINYLPPQLSIIDGFRGMDCDGPDSGRIIDFRAFIASYDFLAADSVCAKLMGFEPLEVGYIHYAHQRGLGNADLSKVKIVGERMENLQRSFKPHTRYEVQKRWR